MSPAKQTLDSRLIALRDADPKIRQKACAALNDWETRSERPRVIAALLPLLDDTDDRVLREAICALASLKAKDPALLAKARSVALDKKASKPTRRQAVYALGAFGSEVVPTLVSLFAAFPSEAGFALKDIGRNARVEDLAPLLELARGDDETVADEACETLAEMRLPVPGLVEALRGMLSDKKVGTKRRIAAAELLGRLMVFDARKDLLMAASQAHEKEPGYLISKPSWAAASALAGFEEEGWEYLKCLLESPTPWVVIAGLNAFENWRQPNDEAVAMIFAATRSDFPRVREKALEMIDLLDLADGAVEDLADPVGALLANLEHEDWEVRDKAVDGLGSLGLAAEGKEAGRVIPALVAMLDDEDFRVREAAVRQLVWWRGHAAPAVPRLMRILAERDEWLQEAERLAGPGARDLIEQTMAEPNKKGGFDTEKEIFENGLVLWVINNRSRWHAAECLAGIGLPAAAPAVPLIRKLLADPAEDKLLIPTLQSVLAALDQDSADVQAQVLAGLKSRRGGDIENALDAVGCMTSPSPELIAAMGKHLSAKSKAKQKALWVAKDLGARAAALAPLVAGLLASEERFIAESALRTLLALECPVPSEAIPLLLKQLESPDQSVRNAWSAGMANLGGEFARQAVPKLRALVGAKATDSAMRATAAIGLANLGDASAPVIGAIRAILSERPDFGFLGINREAEFCVMQQNALLALAHLGRKAKAALPEVKAIANHQFPYVREAAGKAQAALGGP